jgi:hypothetical protein
VRRKEVAAAPCYPQGGKEGVITSRYLINKILPKEDFGEGENIFFGKN